MARHGMARQGLIKKEEKTHEITSINNYRRD